MESHLRVLRYDALRSVSALMVIGTHCAANDLASHLEHPDFTFTFAVVFSAFTRMAVPLFVMLSGAFVLADARNRNFKYFYKKSIVKLGIPTFGWSVGYVAYKYLFYIGIAFSSGRSMDSILWIPPIKNALAGQPYYHLWYLYMLVGLYALVPLLIRFRERSDSGTFLFVALSMCVVSFYAEDFIPMYWPWQWIQYLGYFMIGHCIRHELASGTLPRSLGKCFKGDYRLYALLSVAATVVSIWLVIDSVKGGMHVGGLWSLKYQSPTIQVAAMMCFLAFANWNPRHLPAVLEKLITRIAARSFFIYLIHAGILHLVLYSLYLFRWHPEPVIFIPLATLLIFALSFYLGEALNKTKGHFREHRTN